MKKIFWANVFLISGSIFLSTGCIIDPGQMIIDWFNGKDNQLDPVDIGVEDEEPSTPPTNSILEDLGHGSTAQTSGRTLWVMETDYDLGQPGGDMIWRVNVLEQTTGVEGDFAKPAIGAQVSVEFKDSTHTTTDTAIVGPDGWAEWTTPEPVLDTYMYITDIEGNYPWNPLDKAAAEKDAALSITGHVPTE